jgi:hypothetical protein
VHPAIGKCHVTSPSDLAPAVPLVTQQQANCACAVLLRLFTHLAKEKILMALKKGNCGQMPHDREGKIVSRMPSC